MPVKDIRQGGPLSEARGTVITLPFGQPEVQEFEAMLERAVQANTFDGRVAASETWAVATLQRARLPTDPHRRQPWPELEPYEAPEWFARELLFLIIEIRRHLEMGRAELAACVSVQLGRMSMAIEHKFAWEEHAIRGHKNRNTLEGNRDHHNKQRQDDAAKLAERARAIAAANPRLEYRALQEKVAKELPRNPKTGKPLALRTVRRYLNGK